MPAMHHQSFTVILLANLFCISLSTWCELYVYADPNQGNSRIWPNGGGLDITGCWNTDGNFDNDVISSARLYSRSNYACTAIFYDACGCGGTGNPSETLIAGPNSQNTINFGTVNDRVSCITLTVATPQPTSVPTQKPTLNPTLNPSMNPTAEPTNEPTTEPTTYQPTSYPIPKYTIDYGVIVTIRFEYISSNITLIGIELSKITQDIIDDQVLQNNLTNCVKTNNYNISIVNTVQSDNRSSAEIKAVIFLCNNDAENRLYATFDEHLQKDFVEKLRLSAVEPIGLTIDVDRIGNDLVNITTTKQIIDGGYMTTVSMSESDEEMDFLLIVVIIIVVVLFVVMVLCLMVVIKIKNRKLDNPMQAIEINSTESNNTNYHTHKVVKDSEFDGDIVKRGSTLCAEEKNETDSGEDTNKMYKKDHNIHDDDAIVTMGDDDNTPRYKKTRSRHEDDDMYDNPMKYGNVTKCTATTKDTEL